jgi:hypothetical protein
LCSPKLRFHCRKLCAFEITKPNLLNCHKQQNQEETVMPDPVTRKRHLKKVIDRWESEGGALPDGPAVPVQSVTLEPDADKGEKPPAQSDVNPEAPTETRAEPAA